MKPQMTHRDRVLSALEPHRLRPHPRQARRHARSQPDAHGAFRAVEHGAVAPRAWATTSATSSRSIAGRSCKTFPDGSIEGYFGERYKYAQFEAGRYLEACYLPFAGVNRLEDLDRSHFPSADWFDYSTIRRQAERLREQGFAVCCGTAGDMDFINSIARARGMEQVLMDLIDDSPVYLEIMQARFEFFYEMHRRMLEAAGGLIDFTHVGDDLGNQRGPMIGLAIFEKHFAPKYGKYFDMVHAHGAQTMMHMCGCVERFLPRLIELGLDVYDVVQPTTPQMDIAVLQERFGDRLTFCGSVCVQTTLAWGTVEDVEREVRRRLDLFPAGGLFLGPTHAIQVGSPLENILALYRTAGSLTENIDESILQRRRRRLRARQDQPVEAV